MNHSEAPQGEAMSSGKSTAVSRTSGGNAFVPSLQHRKNQRVLRQHEVQFYFDDRFLISSLSEFIAAALKSGRSAVTVTTKSHRDGLTSELERMGVDVFAAIKRGLLVPLDAAETLAAFCVKGFPDEAPFREVIGKVISGSAAAAAACGGETTVAMFGEMVALLWQRGEAQAALQLERFWNHLAESHSFHLRCAYPLSSFDRAVHTELFSRICCEHHSVIPGEDYTVLDETDRLRTVARLQQTGQALRTEAIERRLAQAQTLKIQIKNERLVKEIRKREAVEDELRRFTRRMLAAPEEEQTRIAAELHKNAAQLLSALSLYFDVLHDERESLSPRLAGIVANSRSISENLVREIRKLSHLLHPPTLDEMGLFYALREYVEQLTASSRVTVDLYISEDIGRFSRAVEVAAFRIVEEALAEMDIDAKDAVATVRLTRRPEALTIDIKRSLQEREQQSESASASGTSQTAAREMRINRIKERVREYGGTVEFISAPSRMTISVTLRLQGDNQAENERDTDA